MGGVITSVGLATVAGAGIASAATNSNGQQTLVEKIASKFNLNKDEVQKVFDEEHASREAKHEQKMNERLDQAVKDGKLTQDQADKLKAKLKEMHDIREKNRDSKQENREAMKKQMDDFKQWLKDNNIPDEYGMPMGGPGRGHRDHGMM